MVETINLTATDGHTMEALWAEPSGKPRGGLLVLQEIFGLTDHLKRLCAKFAEKGYAVCAPALFDRVERGLNLAYVGDDYQKGLNLRKDMRPEWMMLDCQAGIEMLRPAGRVGTIGYCYGGYVAWLAATELNTLDCAISLYGGGVADICERETKCAVQLHFGDSDRAIPLDHVQRIKNAHPEIPTYVYDDAPHAFCTDDRDGAYRPEACKRATARALDFLAEHLD